MTRLLGTLTLAALLAIASQANASTIFLTSGTIGSNPVAGKAEFAFDAHTLTLTLTNQVSDVLDIAQTLTGLSWIGGPALSLQAVTAGDDWACPKQQGGTCEPFLYDRSEETWRTSTESQPANRGWVYGSNSVHPAGGLKPYGLINDTLDVTSDGLGQYKLNDVNGLVGHVPYVMGPLIFTFGYTGDLSPITDATFTWGTDSTQTTTGCLDGPCEPFVPVPEPASMLLFGTGLLGAGYAARRRRK